MPLPTIVGLGAAANGIGAVAAAYPGGYTPITNDVGVIWIECDSTDTITPPSGWAQITNSTVATGTTTKLTALWRRIQSGDSSPTVADAGNHMQLRMIVVRDCITSGNPWDVFASNSELVADTSVAVLSANTTVPNCLCMAAFSTGQDVGSTAGADTWVNASLANVTEQMDGWTSIGTGGGFAMATGEKLVAGTVNATTAVLALTANFKALIFVALKPEPIPPIMVTARWMA